MPASTRLDHDDESSSISPPIGRDRPPATAEITLHNRYDATDLATTRYLWELLELPPPGGREARVISSGEVAGPPVGPGQAGRLLLPLPASWQEAGALRLRAFDARHREVMVWSLPVAERGSHLRRWIEMGEGPVTATEEGHMLTLAAAGTRVEFDLTNGELIGLGGAGGRSPLTHGPRRANGESFGTADVRHFAEVGGHVFEARYPQARARWKLHPSGWLKLSYQNEATTSNSYRGIGFAFPDKEVASVRWLGNGPTRVWQNRLRGPRLGVWERERSQAVAAPWAYEPQLAGFYSGVYWLELANEEDRLTVVLDSEPPYVGLGSPAFPADAKNAVAEVPAGGLTFLHAVSPIGTKFSTAAELGPSGRPRRQSGFQRGVIWFFFGSPAAAIAAAPEPPAVAAAIEPVP